MTDEKSAPTEEEENKGSQRKDRIEKRFSQENKRRNEKGVIKMKRQLEERKNWKIM